MNAKENTLKNVSNQIVDGSHSDFLSMGKYVLWKSMGSINCLVPDILQILFCVQQKKFIQVWNNLRVS